MKQGFISTIFSIIGFIGIVIVMTVVAISYETTKRSNTPTKEASGTTTNQAQPTTSTAQPSSSPAQNSNSSPVNNSPFNPTSSSTTKNSIKSEESYIDSSNQNENYGEDDD